MSEDARIVRCANISEAYARLNRDFRDKSPKIPLRGILTSIGPSFLFPEKEIVEMGFPWFIKNINQVLEDGTELDAKDNYNWTRVDSTPRTNWAHTYFAGAREDIENLALAFGFFPEQKNFLRPALLVYDEKLLIRPEVNAISYYGARIPEDAELAKKVILKAYINLDDSPVERTKL